LSLEEYDLLLTSNNYSQQQIFDNQYLNNNINNDDLFEAYRLDNSHQPFNGNNRNKIQQKTSQQQILKSKLKTSNIINNSEQSSSPSFDFSSTQDFWEDDLHNHSNLVGLNNNFDEYNYHGDDFDIYSESKYSIT
jgi:hypothetical protein